MKRYTIKDVIEAFEGDTRFDAVKEFFYYHTECVGVDMSIELAKSVLAEREVSIWNYDGLTIAHFGGGRYMVNEKTTGIGDGTEFEAESWEEAQLDAVEIWRS